MCGAILRGSVVSPGKTGIDGTADMKSTWLVLDCDYLCHRAYHSVGNLTYGDERTGTLFGFFQALIELQDVFQPERYVFCFDSPQRNNRRKFDWRYKRSRRRRLKEMSEEEVEEYNLFKAQLNLLRTKLLSQIGFTNVLYQTGMEADDIIASVCSNRPENTSVVIAAADHDLYQLLSPSVSIFDINKSKTFTDEKFRKKYGIEPSQWVDVKAIAGCTSDDVIGISGIGETLACKFLRGELNPDSQRHSSIIQNNHIWRGNLFLVRLPFQGTHKFRIRKDQVTAKSWSKVCGKYGFETLKDQLQIGSSHGTRKQKRIPV